MDNFDFAPRTDLQALHTAINDIQNQIAKVIVGQRDFIDLLITALLADGHVLIEGVPGVAKTLTAKLLARTLSVDFSRLQFTPDLMPSDVLGTSIYNFKHSEFEFKAGPIFSNIVLIDEINRAPAKTQSALFEVMEERQISIDGKQYNMEAPFIVFATQNPIEQEGTYRLPEAQLDRFLFKIEVGYPSLDEEVSILERFETRSTTHSIAEIEAILTAESLAQYRQKVRHLLIEPHLLRYIAAIVQQTRHDKSIYLGASPRASLAIMNSAKAYAAMQGRDFVTPEDIQFVVKPVLRHRIILTPEKEMDGGNADEVITAILRSVEVPR
jgi:MoxR-like ATPase